MANDIVEITDAEFDDLLEDQTPQIKKWSDLENKKIYLVTNTIVVDTQMGELMAATLKDNGVVWVLDHLKKRVVENKISPPFFISRAQKIASSTSFSATFCASHSLSVQL